MLIPIFAADAGPERSNVGANCALDRLDVRRRIPRARRWRDGGLGDRNRGQHHAGSERDSRAAIQAELKHDLFLWASIAGAREDLVEAQSFQNDIALFRHIHDTRGKPTR